MNYLELQNRVMTRLSLTSTEARARIKIEINDRLREIASSCGLSRTRRGTANMTMVINTATITVACAKILAVTDRVVRKQSLLEVSVADLRAMDPTAAVTGVPTHYAISSTSHDTETVTLYPIPAAAGTLVADAILPGTDLSADGDEPVLPVDFHDVLVRGVLSDEYLKLEKVPTAAEMERRFEKRLGEMRYFLQKSASKSTQQNGRSLRSGGAVLI